MLNYRSFELFKKQRKIAEISKFRKNSVILTSYQEKDICLPEFRIKQTHGKKLTSLPCEIFYAVFSSGIYED